MKRLLVLRRNEKGQGLVEFALILPLLLLLVLGIIQFGIIFSSQIAITNAAREGARVAAVGLNDEVVERINNSIGGHVFLPTLNAGNVSIGSASEIGEEVTVTISGVKLKLIVPVPDVFVPGNEITLSGKASMRLEKKPN